MYCRILNIYFKQFSYIYTNKSVQFIFNPALDFPDRVRWASKSARTYTHTHSQLCRAVAELNTLHVKDAPCWKSPEANVCSNSLELSLLTSLKYNRGVLKYNRGVFLMQVYQKKNTPSCKKGIWWTCSVENFYRKIFTTQRGWKKSKCIKAHDGNFFEYPKSQV